MSLSNYSIYAYDFHLVSLDARFTLFLCMAVCGKYFSYKLPDAIHSDFSLSYIMTYLPHINYVQNKLRNGFIRCALFTFSHVTFKQSQTIYREKNPQQHDIFFKLSLSWRIWLAILNETDLQWLKSHINIVC